MLSLLFINVTALFSFKSNTGEPMWWYFRLWASSIGTILSVLLLYYPCLHSSHSSSFLYSDGLNSPLITLTWWISGLMLLASQSSVKLTKIAPYLFSFVVLGLNLVLLLTFSLSMTIWFYFWFEASLIPTLILILGWGYQPERLQAGMYMMLYTVSASLPLLILMLWMAESTGSMSMFMPEILKIMVKTDSWLGEILFLFLFAAFLVKLPMFSVHLWLPKAHVEAPVAGSMILAGVLLKLGGYGLVRMLKMSFYTFSPLASLLLSIGVWGGLITGLICIRQVDLKSLIAYSSVGHMGMMLAGAFSNSLWGMQAALLMMIAHGLCSSGLFTLAHYLYEKTGSRSLYVCKGMLIFLPAMAMWWFLLCISNMAAPPTINLLSEIMVFISMVYTSKMLMIPLMAMMFVAAVYNLFLYTATQHGGSPSFLNPFTSSKGSQKLLLLLHWLPLNALIMKPELVCFWLI
uniref:NADH-ubiquinone oxidoreductase chain 4 n=1 Tax=Titiscania limacina TaxID=200181 RepID=A0A1B2G3H6_9GAST|nr:NADH dehydrogenase subunit 4 [Titiscania limacina]